MKKIVLGTAPFCDPDPNDCEFTPGYIATGKEKGGCWTGNKVICEFNEEKWKTTPLYSELQAEGKGDMRPQFTWFGTAPLCGGEACDAYKAGMIPIHSGSTGDGSRCVTGEKWLGMKPILDKHHELVRNGAKECYELGKLKEQTLAAGLSMGSSIAGLIGGIGSGGISSTVAKIGNAASGIIDGAKNNGLGGVLGGMAGLMGGTSSLFSK